MSLFRHFNRPEYRPYAVGLTDQALQSGANFCMTLFLARALSVEEFGIFAMAQVIALFLGVSHTSLVAEPFSVNFAKYSGPKLDAYVHWNNVWLFRLCGVGLAGLLLLAGGTALAGFGHTAKIALCAGLAFPAYLTLWHTRRLCYALGQHRRAVRGTLVYVLVLTAGLALTIRLGLLSACSSMLVFAAASAVLFAPLVRSNLGKAGGRVDDESRRTWTQCHWDYAKWHLGGSVLAGLGQFVAYPVLAATAGIRASGSLRIVETIYTPFNQGLTALVMVLTPRLAALRESSGIQAVQAALRRLRVVLAIGVGVLLLVVAVTGDRLVCAVVGRQQGLGLGPATVLYGVILLGRIAIDMGPALLLRLNQATRAFLTNGWVTGLAGTMLVGAASMRGLLPAIGARLLVVCLSGGVFAWSAAGIGKRRES